MEIVQLTLGALGTNCYLVKREEGVLVIDPAAEPERIASKLASLGWKPDAVVLTHAHFDHMLAANDLPGDTIALGEADVPLLTAIAVQKPEAFSMRMTLGCVETTLFISALGLIFKPLRSPGRRVLPL